MYKVSWQNLLMMNATIPPFNSDKDGDDDTQGHKGENMDMWQIMERIKAGKGA